MATDLNLFRRKSINTEDSEDAEFAKQGVLQSHCASPEVSLIQQAHRDQEPRTMLALVFRLGQVLECPGQSWCLAGQRLGAENQLTVHGNSSLANPTHYAPTRSFDGLANGFTNPSANPTTCSCVLSSTYSDMYPISWISSAGQTCH